MKMNQAKLLLQVRSVNEAAAYYKQKIGWKVLCEGEAGGSVLMEAIPGYNVVISAAEIGGKLESELQAHHEQQVHSERHQHAQQLHEHQQQAQHQHEQQPKHQQHAQQQTGNLKQDNTTDDYSSWLGEVVHRPLPGDCFYIGVPSVEAVRKQLMERGLTGLLLEEDTGSIRKLLIPTIDGHIATYWEELHPSAEEIIALYAQGSEQLRLALQGLDEAMLDLSLAPGKWTIRQNVLHLIDLELVTIHKLKFALAEPGKPFQGTPFSQDAWSEGLAYANRPIDLEVELFAMLRGHVIRMCEVLPDALERYVRNAEKIETVQYLLKIMAGHANHHIRIIHKIRSAHQV